VKETGSAALRLGVAVAVLAGAYLGLAWFLGRHVPADTTVSGVPIGGLTPAAAQSTLSRAFSARASAPVVITAGEKQVELDPRPSGLTLDLAGTVDGLSGFSLSPADLWDHLTGGHDVRLRTSVDRGRLEHAIDGAKPALETPRTEGAITFPRGQVAVVRPVAGSALQVGETADSVAERWPAQGAIGARLAAQPTTVGADEVERADREFATPAMSGPVTLVIGTARFSVPPTAFAPAVRMTADDQGRLSPSVDGPTLLAVVRRAAASAGIEREPRDARITFRGTTPVVVPSVAGARLDANAVTAAFLPALTAADRTARMAVTVVQPRLTTAQAEKIKPREVISTFTTHFPFNPPRTNNITIAARTLDGTYVAPGQQFSLNGTLGERTAAKGYASAPVIEDGRLTKDFGGGVSQVSTTTFNAAFFAGVRIDKYLPHSFYISRYPEGREATVSWPDVDQKWTNDTGAGILIQAGVSGSSITVTFYGTKVWDIEAVKGPRRNVVQPRTIVDDRPGCVPQTPAPGFDVTVTRIFKRGGNEVKRSTFNTHYIPEDNVRCTHPRAS
jgi:vancomycin resistance protein YoaR